MDRRGRFRWRSFEATIAHADRYAAALVARGCGPGERCVIVLPSEAECAHVLLGALRAGAIPLLVAPPVLQPARHSAFRANLAHTLAAVRPRVVVGPPGLDLGGSGSPVAPETLAVEEEAGPMNLAPAPAPGDTVALQLTSGTTGLPRICRWTQAAVLAALDGMERAMELGPEDICFNWTPLYHDMGLVNNFLLCLTAGVPLALLSPTDFVVRPGLWIRGLSDTGATVSWSPNFGFALAAAKVTERDLDGVRLDRVRSIWNAAERVHVKTMVDFHRRFGPLGLAFGALKTNFGCAENVGGATFSDVRGPLRWEDVDVETLHAERRAELADGARGGLAIRIASVGRPVEGMRIAIVDPDGELLPDGHVGEVLLDTPSRMAEYVGDPEATRHAFVGGMLATGDLGYVRDGELFWVGRTRERITIRGKKIDPSEFERILLEVAGLRPGCFVAFGVADNRLGTERPVVVAEVTDPMSRPLPEVAADIHRAVNAELGLMLDDVVLVAKGTLAKTSSGKRRHRHFREVYEAGQLEPLHRSRN